jgi:hypothetical protein
VRSLPAKLDRRLHDRGVAVAVGRRLGHQPT